MSLTTVDFARLQLRPEDRVLDLGCGEGRHAITARLETDADVVGLDLSGADLQTARSRAAEFGSGPDASRSILWVRGSGLALPFDDATFNKVICAEVLEHVPDYEQVLREIQRVLKPGGVLAISVPRFFPEWICWRLSDAYHQVEGGHVRIFRSARLRRAVEDRNLRFLDRHWAHSLHVPYWWLRCLLWERGTDAWPVRTYHRFLVWDLMQKPRLTRWLDRLLNPILGKSVVLYFIRNDVIAS